MWHIAPSEFAAVLQALNANGGQCLPLADLALGASEALSLTGATPVGAAVWLATLTQESAYFRTTTEYGGGQSYAPHIGRTFEQVTWRANYAAFGAWAVDQGLIATDNLFADKPELLGETQWAWLGGVWYFGAHGLWTYANRGDFQIVQNAVNRGTATSSGYPSGWTTRLNSYRAWTSQVSPPAQLPITGAMDPATVKRLQQWIGVGMDGQVGPITYSALQKWLGQAVDGTLSNADVKKLQNTIGAFVDGQWGPGTTRDLQTYLNAKG
jgi:hypothetical protein